MTRALVAAMRAVPAIFAAGWLIASATWLVAGQPTNALGGLVVAVLAASHGVRIALASAAMNRNAGRRRLPELRAARTGSGRQSGNEGKE